MAKTLKLINENDYNVYILPEARLKMEEYCKLCEKEIGWLGFVKHFDGIGYLITDVVLLKQEVNGTTTEIDPEGLLDFWEQTPIDKQQDIKIWGHSHVNMSPSPSGQDDSQMDYFKDGNPWFIRLITNKKGDMNITIYNYTNGFEVHLDELITYYPKHKELEETVAAEIKEKVKEKVYTSTVPVKTYNYYDDDKYYKNSYYKTYPKVSPKTTSPLFKDIEVKYVNNFDEVLNDPNYWQSVL